MRMVPMMAMTKIMEYADDDDENDDDDADDDDDALFMNQHAEEAHGGAASASHAVRQHLRPLLQAAAAG